MKILSTEQLYKALQLSIKNQGITELDLIERAGLQVFNWMHKRMQGSQVKIHIFNGIGNNGGVGLVLARHLLIHGYNIDNYVVNFSKKRTDAFLKNYDKVKELKSWPKLITDAEDFPSDISPEDIIVDAIFGIGLNRDTGDLVNNLFAHLNALNTFKLAIDIPSGLFADHAFVSSAHVLKVNYTLSFQSPKLVFFLPETAIYTEQWEVLDIGLDQEFINTVDAIQLIGKQEVLPMYRMREKFSSKFSYGHALLMGGSYGKIGAVHLSSKAALTSGCGLVTGYIPSCGLVVLQSSFPEAMVQVDVGEKQLEDISPNGNFNVIGVGMGMGTSEKTSLAFINFLKSNTLPLVIDADGLNILSKNKEQIKLLPKQTILTPHKKELERLIGAWKDDFEMLQKVKSFSKAHDCVLVVKDAISLTIYKEDVFVNTSGNPALATAGTGDVLTGIITGLVAQGYTKLDAAIFGVYLHGKTADIGIEKTGYQSFIASSSIENISAAYIDLFKQPELPVEQVQE